MPRPDPPILSGVYESPDKRFTWDPSINPSPMRAKNGELQRQTEGLPIFCGWCGQPYWPHHCSILKGLCCEVCTQEEQDYTQEQSERDQLLDNLREQEADLNRLRAMAGKEVVV